VKGSTGILAAAAWISAVDADKAGPAIGQSGGCASMTWEAMQERKIAVSRERRRTEGMSDPLPKLMLPSIVPQSADVSFTSIAPVILWRTMQLSGIEENAVH
jgi:hypothetical protein